jgi:hypothetical protein
MRVINDSQYIFVDIAMGEQQPANNFDLRPTSLRLLLAVTLP